MKILVFTQKTHSILGVFYTQSVSHWNYTNQIGMLLVTPNLYIQYSMNYNNFYISSYNLIERYQNFIIFNTYCVILDPPA